MTAGAGSRIRSRSFLVTGRVFSLLECLAPVPTTPEVQKSHVICFIFVTMTDAPLSVGYREISEGWSS
jgi:hypothetical protein